MENHHRAVDDAAATAEIFVNNGEKVFTFKAFFTDEKGIEIESEQTIL